MTPNCKRKEENMKTYLRNNGMNRGNESIQFNEQNATK